MTVVPFKRPEKREDRGTRADPAKPGPERRTALQFAVAMAMFGVVFFLMPRLLPFVPSLLLAAIHLLVVVVYVQQGPRLMALAWLALSVVVLAVAGSPSPVTYALSQVAAAADAALARQP